jgi:hypothetical protein
MTGSLPKGFQMEELLRRYFIRAGYFTVRSVPFVYDGFEITDIDIWLYDRPSSVSRHRIIVDTKNKTTPKAIERIFWTKGLKEVLGVEQAIVATTDKRAAVSNFGKEQDVLILDGSFLDRLSRSNEPFDERLTEEQFIELIETYRPTKEGGDWKGRYRTAKLPLARDLGFNAINGWLLDAKFFAEQAQLVITHREIALRMLYLYISFIFIAFDFVTKDLAFCEPAAKLAVLNDGLRFGSQGSTGTKRVLELATGLIDQYAPERHTLGSRIRDRLSKDLDSIPTRILAEYFAKQSVLHDLFAIGKELEAAAYKANFVAPQSLTAGAKGAIGVLLDFWEMDRKTVLLNGDTAKHAAPVQAPLPRIEPKEPT